MIPNIKIQGKVKKIGDIQTFGANGFRKREVVLETEDQYPQFIPIEFTQEKCELLDGFQDGDVVDVDINLRGREWTSPEGQLRYFSSLQGWRIQKAGAQSTPENDTPPKSGAPTESNDSEEDDLPF